MMKSFASIALLALSAFAIDIEVEDVSKYTGNLKFSPDGTAHKHTHPVVHVNVWDTIDEELMELMTEI